MAFASDAKFIDLSVPLYDNCPGIPDVDPPHLRMLANAASGGWNLERIDMALHWGTHMDSPYHQGLAPTMDAYAPHELQGPAVAVDCFDAAPGLTVGADRLRRTAPTIGAGAVVLICAAWWRRRAWSEEWIDGAPRLSLDGARFLAERGIRGVGVEGYSVGGRGDDNYAVHRALLEHGIWIAEGLKLDRELLPPASWHVIALPLLVRESSGAPARVVAVSAEPEEGIR